MRIIDPVAQHSGRAALMERVEATRRAKEADDRDRARKEHEQDRRDAEAKKRANARQKTSMQRLRDQRKVDA